MSFWNKNWLWLGPLIFLIILITQQLLKPPIENQLAFLNVGQGDATYIHWQGIDILIDAGPDQSAAVELGKILPYFDQSLELVIITHWDNDHYRGLFWLIDHFHIEQILSSEIDKNNWELNSLLNKIKKARINLVEASKISFIELGGAKLKLLNNQQNQGKNSDNENSLVLYFESPFVRSLIMGDAPEKIERALMNNNFIQNIDVLKVAHHGSNDATSQSFIDYIKPKLAIISVGDNRFGHPSPRVINRLKRFGVKVINTLDSGNYFIYEKKSLFKKSF